jgi:ABC-type branched-subunit amino acid transport system substrate-binding protein
MPGTRWRFGAVISALVAAGLLLSACSSSGDSKASSGGTTSGASGSTIEIGVIAPATGPVAYPDIQGAASGAVRALNSSGGIDGHPVKLVFCDTAFDPNKEQACARQMVSDQVIATAGDFTPAAEPQVIQILAAAGIPSVGTWTFSSAGTGSPYSYPFLDNDFFDNAAQVDWGMQAGGKRVAEVRVDIPSTSTWGTFVSNAVNHLGGTMATSIAVPSTATDLASQAAAVLASKPDVVNINLSDSALVSLVNNMDQLGYKGKFVTTSGTPTEADLKSLGSRADQVLFVSPFPPPSAAAQIPGVEQFVQAMAAERRAGDSNAPASDQYVRAEAMNAYVAVMMIAKVAAAAKSTDAKSLKSALDAASNVDLGGLIPPWTPSRSLIGQLPRISNGRFFYVSWNNGKPNLSSTTPTNVTAIVKASYAG